MRRERGRYERYEGTAKLSSFHEALVFESKLGSRTESVAAAVAEEEEEEEEEEEKERDVDLG